MSGLTISDRDNIEAKINSKKGALKHVRAEKRRIALALPQINGDAIKQINQEEFDVLIQQETKLNQEIQELQEKIPNVDEEILSQEDFLNISENAEAYVKSGNEYVKDTVCRMIFSNIVLKDGKVASYQLKEPFLTSMKRHSVKNGRGCRTRTGGLTHPMRAR